MRLKLTLGTLFTFLVAGPTLAQQGNFVPGSGNELENVGDDFEDPNWAYNYNNPKSTEEINELQNQPLGKSANGRWFEGVKRGQPDVVQRVETPPGGLPGSRGALLLRSLQTGVPGRPSHKMQQEDFIMNVQYRTGGPVGVSQNPSVTTRVYLPPTDQWERRSGPHFAFRVALETTKKVPRKFISFANKDENEIYWPGLFICMDVKEQTKAPHDHIYFRIRSNGQGGDMMGPDLTTTGWWTLGISVSANGAVHYYAKPGVEDLTQDDYVTTQYPYSYRAERFRSAFFNVINGDNGRDWSTTWIIDDTKVFLGTGQGNRVARLANAKANSAKDAGRGQPPTNPLSESKQPGASNETASKPGRPQPPPPQTPQASSSAPTNNSEELEPLELDYYR